MHSDPQSLRKAQIEPVEGRVGQHNISHRAIAFESDRHLTSLPCSTPGQTLTDRSDTRQQITLGAISNASLRRP
jgi:hypothetical protein